MKPGNDPSALVELLSASHVRPLGLFFLSEAVRVLAQHKHQIPISGSVCHGDVCDGCEHASENRRLRLDTETRRNQLQGSLARFSSLVFPDARHVMRALFDLHVFARKQFGSCEQSMLDATIVDSHPLLLLETPKKQDASARFVLHVVEWTITIFSCDSAISMLFNAANSNTPDPT